jgi:hypothetical protein
VVRARRLAAAAIAISACGGAPRGDSGPLDPVARSYGLACDMGVHENETCGPQPNACFAITTGSMLPSGDLSEKSALLFCARWCKAGCPSGTFCPNPDHASMDSLFAGVCFRACANDADCPASSVCDPSAGGGGCVPSCATGHTVCSKGSTCLQNGHCSGPQPH